MDSSISRLRVDAARPLAEGETLPFSITVADRPERCFMLRYQGRLRAYFNRCPHLYLPLDHGDDRYYKAEFGRLYCRNHGALFEPNSGVCVAGPCLGATLVALRVEESAEAVWVEWIPPSRLDPP